MTVEAAQGACRLCADHCGGARCHAVPVASVSWSPLIADVSGILVAGPVPVTGLTDPSCAVAVPVGSRA